MLGGVGAGVYPDHRAGAAAVAASAVGDGQRMRPDQERAEAYRALYEQVWLRLPDQLGPLAEFLGLPEG